MDYFASDHSYLQSWARFNEEKWGCQTKIARFQDPGSDDYAESLFFLNQRGKFYLPPLTAFQPTYIHSPSGNPERWNEMAALMADEMIRCGGAASFSLPPEITDIRPFLQRGFKANVKYTFYIQLPYEIGNTSNEIRNRIKKASSEQYVTTLSHDMEEVCSCLLSTEERKGFKHHLLPKDLELAQNLFGKDSFRCYVTYSKDGEPTSSNVLIVHNKHAYWWIAGNKASHLSSGVAPLSFFQAVQDLGSIGVSSVDLVGANIPSISRYKNNWGGELKPYYQLRLPIFKDLFRSGVDWLKYKHRLNA